MIVFAGLSVRDINVFLSVGRGELAGMFKICNVLLAGIFCLLEQECFKEA